MLAAFILTPVTIAKLGMGGYGVYESMFAICSIVGIFEGGISGSLLRFLSADYSKKDRSRNIRLVGTSLSLNALLSTIVIPILLIANPYIAGSIERRIHGLDHLLLSLNILAMSIAVQNVQTCYLAMISATQRTGVTNWIVAGGRITATIIALVGVLSGYGILALAVGELVRNALLLIGSLVVIRRIDPELPYWPVVPQKNEIKEVLDYGGKMFVIRLTEGLSGNTDRIVLGFISKFEWAGYYGIAARLVSLLNDVAGFTLQPLVPAISSLWEQNRIDLVNKIYLAAMRYLAFSLGLLVSIIIGLQHLIEKAWLNKVSHEVAPFLFSLSFVAFVHLCTGPATSMCRGIGKVGLEAGYSIVSVVLNLTLTILLVILIGPYGTVVATIVAKTVSCIYFYVTFHRSVPVPLDGLKSAAKGLFATFTFGTLAYLCLNQFSMPSGRVLAIALLAGLTVVLAVGFTAISVALGIVDYSMIKDIWRTRKPSRAEA